LFLVNPRSPQIWSGNTRQLGSFLLATVALPSMNRFLPPKQMKSSCFATSSPADSGFLTIPSCPQFWISFPWRFINYHWVRFWSYLSFSGLWRPWCVTLVLMCSHDCSS
jgi:hypothetical protein